MTLLDLKERRTASSILIVLNSRNGWRSKTCLIIKPIKPTILVVQEKVKTSKRNSSKSKIKMTKMIIITTITMMPTITKIAKIKIKIMYESLFWYGRFKCTFFSCRIKKGYGLIKLKLLGKRIIWMIFNDFCCAVVIFRSYFETFCSLYRYLINDYRKTRKAMIIKITKMMKESQILVIFEDKNYIMWYILK